MDSGSKDSPGKENVMCKGMEIKMDYLGSSSSFSISKALCVCVGHGGVMHP